MIVFKNEGELDINSIITFGVSVKEKEGAIGFFGTGLKYAIAVLLREGCSITIRSGMAVYEFALEELVIKSSTFSRITMNGHPLAFTTEYGKTWQLWQAARELYSNCLDEDGEVTDILDESFTGTQVIINGYNFEGVWANRRDFLLETIPIWIGGGVEVHPGESDYVYYQGIRVYKLGTRSKYTYNIQTKQVLTEDRTLASWWSAQHLISDALTVCDNIDILDNILLAGDFLESKFDFEYFSPGREFADRVGFHIRNSTEGLNQTVIKDAIRRRLTSEEEVSCDAPPEEVQVIQDAMEMVTSAGFDIGKFNIKIVESLGEGETTWAMGENIFLSRKLLEQGGKKVAAVLLENFLKVEKNLYTGSEEMQEFLLETIIRLANKR